MLTLLTDMCVHTDLVVTLWRLLALAVGALPAQAIVVDPAHPVCQAGRAVTPAVHCGNDSSTQSGGHRPLLLLVVSASPCTSSKGVCMPAQPLQRRSATLQAAYSRFPGHS